MGLEDAARVSIEQTFATLQPNRSFGSEPATVKIELPYFLEPALQLFQLDVVFFELVVGKMLASRFLGDFGFEVVTFVDELAISIVPIGLEAGNDLVMLHTVQRDRLQDDRVAAHLGDPGLHFRIGKGSIRPDGRKLHDMYLFEVKRPNESRHAWDYYKLRATIPAAEAFRPLGQGGCPLVGG